MLLGSHAPLFEPRAAIAKLPDAGSYRREARLIGTASARKWIEDDWMPWPEWLGDPP